MRVILFTGKGGVGKTSVAAATALRSAEMGYKTIILSTDAAHSLSDSYDFQLGNEPVKIKVNLWGQETEIHQAMESYWGIISRYMSALLAWRGMDDIVADEVAVIPGMEELANLLYISRYQDEGKYDVVIIDCAPTGETLRLLSFPDMLHWWMTRIFPIQRKVASAVRPMVGAITDMPLPTKGVFDAISELYNELFKIHNLLTDVKQSSIRLVVNPEKMVIKEAQRTLTYLNLFGYYTDAIICNRIIPEEVSDNYFKSWKESQNKYRRMIKEGFSPLPILNMPLLDQEVVGVPMLEQMAKAIYGKKDPAKIFYQGRVQEIDKENGIYVMSLNLPFTGKDKISLKHNKDELDVQVASYRRNIVLPRMLRGLEIEDARFEDTTLKIKFKDNRNNKTKAEARK
jgi:arsenite/tail-anchored protein-transporting ATPase